MSDRRPIAIGDIVAMTRSGHSRGSLERAIVVAVHGGGRKPALRVRWPDGRQSVVPADVVEPQGR